MEEIKYDFNKAINPIQGKKGMIFSGDKNIDRVILLDDTGKYYFSPVKIGTIMTKFNIMLGFERGIGITKEGTLFIRKD